MKALSIILLAIATVMTAACAKDNSIAVTLHDKVPPTPPGVEQKAISLLASGAIASFDANVDSASSATVRAGLIGINVKFSPAGSGQTTISGTLSEKNLSNPDQCSVRTFSGTFSNSAAQTPMEIQGVGHMVCLDQYCSSVLFVIEHSSNQAKTTKGWIDAAVPVILAEGKNDKNISTGSYLPTASENGYFMRFEQDVNTLCNDPVQSQSFTGPVLPDGYAPSTDYNPSDDYSTWF